MTPFWPKRTCQIRLVFVSHFSTTFFSEFTICQKEKKKVNLTLMRARIHWVHINILSEEEKVLERSSTYFAFVSASVPAQIGCKIEAHR